MFKIYDKVISKHPMNNGEKGLIVSIVDDNYIIKGFTWGDEYMTIDGEMTHKYSACYLALDESAPIESYKDMFLRNLINNL